MNPLDRVIAFFAPDVGLRRQRARQMLQRAYEGASLRDGWRPRRAGASANADHQADAYALRVRARSLVQNVPYIARAIDTLVSRTIGTGITPVIQAKRQKKRYEDLWAEWESQADADGVYNIYGLQAAAYRAMEIDGEVLIRRRWRRPEDGLAVPLQLQLLEIDWLDSAKSGPVAGGGQIINGIEYDAIGRVRNYWLHGMHPGDRGVSTGRIGSYAVSAKDIIHLYAPTRPGQGRGITRLASVIARSRDLMLYEDAELQRKNLETRLGIVATGDVSGMSNPTDNGTITDPRDLGNLSSGGITQLPGGLNLTQIEPKASPGVVDYVKMQLHLIASGIGVPYESMTGDMSEVNFSSARIRQIEFRGDREQCQWLVVNPRLNTPIYRWFVEAAELAGKISNPEYGVDWSTPRWDYVNPAQDVKADIEAIGACLLTPSEALRRRGYKPEQVFAEAAADMKALSKSGALELTTFFRKKTAEPAQN